MPASSVTRKDVRFWDRIAPRYARSAISDQTSYAHKLSETAALMRPDMKVLEIGCGTGSTALHHAAKVADIRATDLSPAMLDIARQKATRAGIDNVTFQQGAAEDVANDQTRYDMIMAHSILHLVRDPAQIIRAMSERLVPGGYLVTSTVCMSDGMAWFRLISAPGHMLGLLPHISYLSEKDLERFMKDAGLEIHTHWRPGPRKAVFMIGQKPG